MRVIYVPEELPSFTGSCVPDSIFLAGPTPRSEDVQGWREAAVELLSEAGYDGYVFIPQTKEWGWCGNYERQVEWEWAALGRAARILFWIPRDLKDMPAFTTNVEFGFMVTTWPERVVLGFPEGAPKNRYLASIAGRMPEFTDHLGLPHADPIPVYHDLKSALLHGVQTPNGC